MSLIRYGKDLATFTKRLRQDREWSQSDLASMLGIHPQYVSNVERGSHKDPVAFGSLLFNICEKARQDYLMDLIADAGAHRAVKRIKRKNGGGKWCSPEKSKRSTKTLAR